MLGSMYSAVSGLSAHQMKMNVIGNNIANVNTYGFKSSRVTFSDVFYQTLTAASTPTPSAGGTNPAQLGYGSMVKSIDVINTRAGSATTDRPLDVYVNGEGYLPVKDSGGVIRYTRVGVLSFDVAGNLVDSSGNMVLGLAMDPATGKPALGADGTVDARNLIAISVDPAEMDKYTGISISSKGEITAIKEGDPMVTPAANTGWLLDADVNNPNTLYRGNVTMNISRVGNEVSFLENKDIVNDFNFIEVDTSADINGRVTISMAEKSDDPNSYEYTLHYFNKNGQKQTATASILKTDLADSPSPILNFEIGSGSGHYTKITVSDDENFGLNIKDDGASVTIGNVVASEIKIDAVTYDKSGDEIELAATWKAGAPGDDGQSSISLGDINLTLDPVRFGTLMGLTDVMIGNVGSGTGVPTKIANMAIVNFANADGLSQTGEGYYVETENSGQPVGTVPGDQGTGSLRAGALEMSNVDLSREFTEMIIAQRGFQANTRMITVSDEMLSELINMKR